MKVARSTGIRRLETCDLSIWSPLAALQGGAVRRSLSKPVETGILPA